MNDPSLRERFEGQLLERRYRLVRLLSAGNFGGVFHARLEMFGEPMRDVAVKVTKQANLTKETAREIFGEAMTLIRVYDRIADPVARNYIVPIYDLGLLEAHEDRGFIVMGLIRGVGSTAEQIRPPDTLGAKIAAYGAGMPLDVAIEFFRQICAGLAAMHDLDVIHRDLKPDNILLTDRGQIRIVDFGLAAGLNASGFAAGVAGTHRYMAPETALYSQSDAASDVYSLGIILYEMLTGQYPFESLVPPPALVGQDREAWILEQKRRTPLKPPRDIQRQVPRWLSDLAMDCLKFRPADGRPRSARELLQRLDEGPQSREAEIGEELARVDELLAAGWQEWLAGERDWAGAAARLREAAAKLTSPSAPQWFEVTARLALCYIQLEEAAKANEVLRQLDQQIERGVFLHSYRERAEFYEGIARMVQGKRGLVQLAIVYGQKARQAREKGGLAPAKS
jgi:eukaryotic-like serine/threonine-protein kinase